MMRGINRMLNFKNLGLNDNLIKALANQRINAPTPIQERCFEHIMNNIDIIGESKTGSGKTLAFLLPIFNKISPKDTGIQALILTPTRELAIQITQEAEKLNTDQNYKILSVYGGKDINSQLKKLRNNVNMVIATPGRLLDHLGRGTISFEKLKCFVIDEADQMLLMGFKNEVSSLIESLPRKRQTLCFSATLNSDVKKLAYKNMINPEVIVIEEESNQLENIDQYLITTTDRLKQEALCSVLDRENPFMAIIFCRTKRRVDKLEEDLYRKGYNCVKLHSDIPQGKRERIMKSFKKLDIQYLIATEVASRGLHVDGVTHIFNYDMPETPESYVHRIGRTGRAGNRGEAFTFAAPKDQKYLSLINNELSPNFINENYS